MCDTRPSNLKETLIKAKNTSELMVDLDYVANFYNWEDLRRGLQTRRGAERPRLRHA